ncbi:hypothetical protein Tco_0251124 [Tanacetum coccineum]
MDCGRGGGGMLVVEAMLGSDGGGQFCRHLCQHHVPSAATAAIVSAVCQANDHGFGGLGGFSALDLYEYFEQLDLFLMVKHGCHV